jgi:ABC-type uncharacterized transport system substrate-binding protein
MASCHARVNPHKAAVCLTSSEARYRGLIAELAMKNQLPAIYGFREFVDAGGLMTYGVNIPTLCRRAAVCVDKILKGANPGDLPSSSQHNSS